MVVWKPHRARTRLHHDEAGQTGSIEDIGHEDFRFIECLAQPMQVQRAHEVTGLDITAPWAVYMEIGDVGELADGDELVVNIGTLEKTLSIRGPVVMRAAGMMTDCAIAVCEEVRR